jgi:hypothetical protein
MGQDHFTAWERETLAHFIVVGEELALLVSSLRARYLTAHLDLADAGLIVFTVADERAWVMGALSVRCRRDGRVARSERVPRLSFPREALDP